MNETGDARAWLIGEVNRLNHLLDLARDALADATEQRDAARAELAEVRRNQRLAAELRGEPKGGA